MLAARGILSMPLEVWCRGLTRCPVKAEIAGSNPVTSASTNAGLMIQDEEGLQLGSWPDGHDFFVLDPDLLEQQPGDLPALLLGRPVPRLPRVGQGSSPAREPRRLLLRRREDA